jgi:hypothetical protein
MHRPVELDYEIGERKMIDKREEIWKALDERLTKSISNAYSAGQKDERERIIYLLEGLFDKSVLPGYQTAIADAIALIKVKTNE